MILCDNQCLELVFKDKESELYFPTIFEAPKLVHAKFFLYWLIFLYKKKRKFKSFGRQFQALDSIFASCALHQRLIHNLRD